ncbi:MAG: hypothetical protein HY960_01160 [Ignavibacteriae bacterium]|nr:hypothetical protein [Ignavibacteriota bacterium]
MSYIPRNASKWSKYAFPTSEIVNYLSEIAYYPLEIAYYASEIANYPSETGNYRAEIAVEPTEGNSSGTEAFNG